jgi:hypothetical protein
MQVAAQEVDAVLREGLDYYLAESSDPDFMDDPALYDGLLLAEVCGWVDGGLGGGMGVRWGGSQRVKRE